MNVFILNDTSTERHHGCRRVMDNIYQELARKEVEVVGKSYLNADLRAISVKEQLNRCDVAIINGEGTIHHGRQYAEELLRLVAESSAKIKVLCNSTYDSNPVRYRDYLLSFDHIFVRDRRSQAELSGIDVEAVVVPDMTFLSDPCTSKEPNNHVLVSDSVDRDVLVALYEIGKSLGHNARPMSIFEPRHGPFRRLIEIRQSLAKQDLSSPAKMAQIARARYWFSGHTCDTHKQFAEQIAQSSFLLTGRYHAVCMAIKNRTPFLAIDSNTFKIRALLEDVGIEDRCVAKPDFLADADFEQRPFSTDELERIEDFDQKAKKSIQDMFTKILAHG